tara:strand:+ start:569 stop:856 length:288 start_codon:yes stop_codon:yes gene_type:complete
MAIVTIENATVARIIEGYGFKATEDFKLQSGEYGKRWFTVWTKAAVKEGDVVSLEGELSVKIEEYTNRDNEAKTSAAIHLNNALVSNPNAEDAPF